MCFYILKLEIKYHFLFEKHKKINIFLKMYVFKLNRIQ